MTVTLFGGLELLPCRYETRKWSVTASSFCGIWIFTNPKARPASFFARINQHEKKWLDLPWQKVRDSVEVKLYQLEGELYVLAKSSGRQAKEIAMRRKRLARLLRKLRVMRQSLPQRDQLLLRIGARLVKIFMRRGCSTGVSRQGVLDSGCHVAHRAQAEQGQGRAARCSCLGGCVLRDNALGTG